MAQLIIHSRNLKSSDPNPSIHLNSLVFAVQNQKPAGEHQPPPQSKTFPFINDFSLYWKINMFVYTDRSHI